MLCLASLPTLEESLMPQAYWIIPLEAGGGQIDNSLPGGWPGHVAPPIYHPGHPSHGLPSVPGHPANRPPGSWGGPTDPGYGRPIYHPGHPDHGLPSVPGHPGNVLPPGEDVDIENDLPPIPPEYADKVIVAIKRPNVTEWTVKAYDVNSGIDNSLPPAPEPK
jgi:hypothetical protein